MVGCMEQAAGTPPRRPWAAGPSPAGVGTSTGTEAELGGTCFHLSDVLAFRDGTLDWSGADMLS